MLADLGARVIKVERPDGGDFARHYDTAARGLASHFVWCNRGKESIALDPKDPRGLDVLRRLIAGADVFVQNLAHGAAARMGLDAATLCAAHPRLVAVDISGYGADGPYAHKRAYDMLVQYEAGLVSVTGTPEQPVKAGIPAADIAAAMYAYSGVLAALLPGVRPAGAARWRSRCWSRWRSGWGHPLHHVMHGGTEPARTGVAHAVIAPYNACATADGQVLLSVQNDREWRKLTEQVLGRPELAEDPAYATNTARAAHRAETDKAVGEALAGMTAAEAIGAWRPRASRARGSTRSRRSPRIHSSRRATFPKLCVSRGDPTAGGGLGGGAAARAAAAGRSAGRRRAEDGCGAGAGRAHRSAAASPGDDRGADSSAAPGRRDRLSVDQEVNEFSGHRFPGTPVSRGSH
ncbi:CaiB/BaiF CoA transferase family protein [Streptomyces sp. NPDC059994]|uniref:CaiB/BaiF CoA transferase family protein n=1 Tax=Streptomyces sp. NPDC059994 TaxID=3347029 RepID=UPI00368EE6E0